MLGWGPSSYLRSSPHRPLNRAAHSTETGFPQREKSKRESETGDSRKAAVSYNLTWEGTHRHFCWVLCIRNESQRCAQLRGLHKDRTTRKWGHWEPSWKLSFPVVVQSLSHVQLFATQWTVTHQAPLLMGFPRQEYWSGSPFPPPGDLPNPGIKSPSPALAGRFFATEPPGKAHYLPYLL